MVDGFVATTFGTKCTNRGNSEFRERALSSPAVVGFSGDGLVVRGIGMRLGGGDFASMLPPVVVVRGNGVGGVFGIDDVPELTVTFSYVLALRSGVIFS